MYQEIRFAGFGGQGIILAGYITGRAVTIYDKLFATLVQNYGPESRGGACSAQLIISDEPISYPNLTRPDILVVMSQEAWNKYAGEVKPGGIMLVEEDMVTVEKPRPDIKMVRIPATRLAEEIGKKMVANIVMLGALTATAKIIPEKAMQSAIKSAVPPGTEDLNLKAFRKGFEYASNLTM